MEIERLVVGALQTNCYVLKSDGEAAVIDPGAPDERILEAVDGQGLELKHILLTHAHFDHLEGAALLKERHPRSRLALHRADLPIMEHFAPELHPDAFLEEGDAVAIGKESLRVWHTPGHSPGSVIFLHEEGQLIFSGDLLFAGSIGRTDLPGGSPAEMERSLRRLVELESKSKGKGDFAVYPGHGPPTTLTRERASNPFLRELVRQMSGALGLDLDGDSDSPGSLKPEGLWPPERR